MCVRAFVRACARVRFCASIWQRPKSKIVGTITMINCLLTICVHNYYEQPIYYNTYVTIYCKSLTDQSISRPAVTSTEAPPHGLNKTKSERTADFYFDSR